MTSSQECEQHILRWFPLCPKDVAQGLARSFWGRNRHRSGERRLKFELFDIVREAENRAAKEQIK